MNKIESLKNPEIPTPETVKIPRFGEVKIISAVNEHACVFPVEPKNLTNEGAEKSFGSFGYAMALLGANPHIAIRQVDGPVREYKELTPEQAVDLVNGWERFEGREPAYYRTTKHEGRGIGFAHVDCASRKEYEELYDIPSEKVIEMRNYVLNKEKMMVEVPGFTRGNSVAGVIEVKGNKKTVKSTDDLGNKFIILDTTRYYRSLIRLVNYARSQGVKVDNDTIIKKAKKQKEATLGLSVGGKPKFTININGGTPIALEKGFIRPIPHRA